VGAPDEATAPAGAGAAEAAAAPDDANDLRGFHFRRLLRKPLTPALVGGFAIAAGAAGAAFLGPALGGAAALAALLIALLVVFGIADSRAEEAFFETYAAQRGLTLGGRESLPMSTPLLCRGTDRYARRTFAGALGDGVKGTLALYTYEETTTSEKSTQTNYCNYTLGLVEIPQCAGHVPELYCQRKFGLRSLERLEDAFRRSKQRVELESEALDERYEIFAGKEQDAVWLRELFSPTFIIWLTESAPKKFAFELVGGTLCCFVPGHKKRSEELDEVCAASATVARRLREEALE
jgi:hypothetical protein